MAYKGNIKQRWHRLKKWPAHLLFHRKGQSNIIWVAGVPRSGTNMIMNAFDNHPDTLVLHEADPIAYDNYSLNSNETLKQLFAKQYAPFLVGKALLDADRLPELLDEFPGSVALWPIRNFYDLINSHMVLWPDFREQMDEIVTGMKVDKWRGRNISATTLKIVQDLYFPECSTEDCKALLWLIRNYSIFDNGLDTSDRVMIVRYEDFVQNPTAGCARISDFTGLPYNVKMTLGIHAKSIKKANRPPLNPAIEQACLAMQQRLIKAYVNFKAA